MSRFARRLAVSILLCCGVFSVAADDRVVITCSGTGKQIYLPAGLAVQLGYFRQQGLEVELQGETADSYAEDQMLAGAVNGVVGFYSRTISLQARGEEAESVVQFTDVPGEVEMVAAAKAGQLASPADFGGRRLGVTALGSSTQFLTEFLARSSGVAAGNYSLVPVGAGNKFIAAMREGRIDAGMTTEPTVSRLLKNGVGAVLLDLRRRDETRRVFGGPYPAAGLFMQTAWVRGHHAQVQKLVNALVAALRYIHGHSAQDIAAHLPAEMFAGDRTAYVRALEQNKDMFLAGGRMPDDGPPTVLKTLAAVDPNLAGRRIDLSRTYTTEFVDAAASGKP